MGLSSQQRIEAIYGVKKNSSIMKDVFESL